MAPAANGHYIYVSGCAPPRLQSLLSYFSGWLSTISWQSIVAVDCCVIGGIIQALIAVNDPTYNSTRWADTLLTILTALLVAAFNTFAASHLSLTEGVFTTCHVFAFVPLCATLCVLVSPKSSPSEVFAQLKDHTGTWPSVSLSALVGQTANILTTLRSDAVANLAGEVENAGVTLPQGMIWAFLLNMPLTFIMVLTYTFNIGVVDDALKSPYPFVYALHNALRIPSATTAFTVVVMVLLVMITISTMAATSRQTFAFA